MIRDFLSGLLIVGLAAWVGALAGCELALLRPPPNADGCPAMSSKCGGVCCPDGAFCSAYGKCEAGDAPPSHWGAAPDGGERRDEWENGGQK